jgi:hypothetical protein
LDTLKVTPVEAVTDAAAVYPPVLDELIPVAWHHVERWANNRIESDRGRLKHRLRPMRGLRTVIIAGLAFCGTFVAVTTNSPSTSCRWRTAPGNTECNSARDDPLRKENLPASRIPAPPTKSRILLAHHPSP